MRSMTLRRRLLAALAVIIATLGVVIWIVLAVARGHLTDQLDNRLTAATRVVRLAEALGQGERPTPPDRALGVFRERIGTMYELIVRPDAPVEVVFAPNLPGADTAPPDLDWDDIADSTDAAFTASGTDPGSDYRVLATLVDDKLIIARAVSLDEVDDTIGKLFQVLMIGLALVLAACAAVARWVFRLGIRPIEAMTATASTVAEGDLAQRVDEPRDTRTETGQLARALNTMLGRIEQAADAQHHSEARLRRFVADASHELRTPITTIRGYTELYRTGGLRSPAELDAAMRRTHEEAQRMGRLIDDMLTLAKLDRLPTHQFAPVDLTAVLADTVADLSTHAPDHHIRFTPDDAVVVIGDADGLRQVAANVIRNATVHTPAGTLVTVSIAMTGDWAIIEVRDGGPGMTAEHLERAKERFYRADRSRSRDRGGTGLGLAVATSIVTSHSGTLDLASETAEGTTVTIRLPLQGPAEL